MKFTKWVLFVIAFLAYIIFVRDYSAFAISWLNYKAFPIASFFGFIKFLGCWTIVGLVVTLFMWIGGLIILICPNPKVGTITFISIYYIHCGINYFICIQNNQHIWQHIIIDLCAMSMFGNILIKINKIKK